jgi:hypothetical protein
MQPCGLGAVRLFAPVVALPTMISVVPGRGFTVQLTALARQCRSDNPN